MLKADQVRFEPASFVDPAGRVFYHEGGVYRGIAGDAVGPTRRVLESVTRAGLFEHELIETEIAPLEVEGFELVLRHRRIPFVSYALEWCGPMLKAAALATLDLSLRLEDLGLELKDAHPWNMLFDAARPQFIDFCSIVSAPPDGDWRARHEFELRFLRPLELIARGGGAEARRGFANGPEWGVSERTLADHLSSLERLARRLSPRRCRLRASRRRRRTLEALREEVERIDFPLPATAWSKYHQSYEKLSDESGWNDKLRVPVELIRQLRPATLLDIACNTGWFSRHAVRAGSRVVAFDIDETCVSQLYLETARHGEPILPLLMDFTRPSPLHGCKLHYPAAPDRLRCEMTLALAVVHHLVFKQGLRFEPIADHLAAYTSRRLLVEFVPREDRYVSQWYNDSFDWYHAEGFKAALASHFKTMGTFPSAPEPRIFLLCEK